MSAPLNNQENLPIEDIKQGIQTFSMYYYKSLLDAGFSESDAKERTAQLLESQYNFFCEQGKLERKSLGTVEQKIGKVLEMVKEEATNNVALRSVYQELLSIQSQLKR